MKDVALGLANIVWAFEKAKVSHPALFGRVADHIVGLAHHSRTAS